MSLLIWTVGAIVSAFIGVLLTVLFQDRISEGLLRTMRGFSSDGGRRTLAGEWYTFYCVSPERGTSPSASAAKGAVEIIRLRQVGSRVAGANSERTRNYTISAVLQADYCLTGTWRNFIDGRYNWGAFQLCWLDNGQGLVGKFAGKDSSNHINHGLWLWARTQDGLYSIANWTATIGGYGSTASRPGPDASALKARLDDAFAKSSIKSDGPRKSPTQ
jgi:hypothetical protein